MHDNEAEDAKPQTPATMGVVRSSVVRWPYEDSGKTMIGRQIEDA